jgi:hypothetical protein
MGPRYATKLLKERRSERRGVEGDSRTGTVDEPAYSRIVRAEGFWKWIWEGNCTFGFDRSGQGSMTIKRILFLPSLVRSQLKF